MVYRSGMSLLGVLLAGGCFSEPPTTPAEGATESAGSTTGPSGSESGRVGSSSESSSSTTTTPPGSSGTTFEPETTGFGSSSTGPIDPTTPSTTGPPPNCAGAPNILYLAFDGVELTAALADNAPELLVFDPLIAGVHGPYTGDDRAQLLESVRGHFQPFGLCVTDLVPDATDYDMLVVTSDTLADGNALGFEALDCGNSVANNVNVVFLSDEVQIGGTKRAIAISKFAAGLYGLESLGPPATSDLMNRFVAQTLNGATFTEPCLELDSAVCISGTCPQGQQSSFDRLTAAFN